MRRKSGRPGSGPATCDRCRGCRFKPAVRTGKDACPCTTLYWDFLLRHATRLASHPGMALQGKNLARLDEEERMAIVSRAAAVRRGEWDAG